jgi:membrane protease YdiL (CAAX protease family)
MKKCPYCGKEYPDDVERCLIDDEILLGGELPSATKEIIVDPSTQITNLVPSAVNLTDRQMRIIEVVLVCLIAFGTSILSSGHALFLEYSTNPSSSGSSGYNWIYTSLRQLSALGLLWYVLQRRGMSLTNLGFIWTRGDVGRSILLRIGGSLAFYGIYFAIYFSGLTHVSHKESSAHVSHILFGGGISAATILFQFINPFFEELIARAYVMTEIKFLTNSATKAIIVSTLLQTSYHFYQGAPMALAHGGTFLTWSIYYAKTNRIAPIILAHLYSDVGYTLLYLFRQ